MVDDDGFVGIAKNKFEEVKTKARVCKGAQALGVEDEEGVFERTGENVRYECVTQTHFQLSESKTNIQRVLFRILYNFLFYWR